jgi:UDP-4-amino-4-deoxy-L-arabinose-oxoglutarate aminotransferase
MEIRKDFLPLSRPSIGEKEIEKVVSCLKSGWITTGPLCKAFEEKFCELTGATYALSLSSGTAGMHLLLLGLDIKRGDEIITPSMTFASTLNMIALLGAKPVFVDIHYDTLNINAISLRERLQRRRKPSFLSILQGPRSTWIRSWLLPRSMICLSSKMQHTVLALIIKVFM